MADDGKTRAVYQDLMCMGLSSRNIEKVLGIVLRDLLEIELSQLPGKTFSNLMMLEAQYVAQIHVADELSNAVLNDPDNTLHSDGTSKKGHSYLTYDCNKGDSTTLVNGLRCVGGGDAETQLSTFKEILDDLSQADVSNNEINDANCNNDVNDNHTDKDDNNFVSNVFFFN